MSNSSLFISFLVFLLSIQGACADDWKFTVWTTGDEFDIYRHITRNVSFNLTEQVDGNIAPIEGPRGRILRPYHSYYEDLKFNDVRLKERTGALEGSYHFESNISLNTSSNKTVTLNIIKPAGTNVFTINLSEPWPVRLYATKSIEYSGIGINNQEFDGNNRDFVGTNFLYNKEFSKESSVNLSLTRMNLTILAMPEHINSIDVEATRSLDYNLKTHTTGIADISYMQSGSRLERGPSGYKYPVLNEGEERFVGDYEITKKIHMNSSFDIHVDDDDWLPCCTGGWDSMRYYDKKGFGKSTEGVFNCKCYNVPAKAQL